MTTNQDPVVRDLTKHINRSAGQHRRYSSEGHESAKRLLGEFRRVDTSQMTERIEFAGPEPDDYEFHQSVQELKEQGQAAFVIVMMILALAVIAFYSLTA